MSLNYQVNIAISAGCDFYHEFVLANPDRSAMDITGFKFYAALAKHSNSINAVESTRDNPVPNCIQFDTRVVDGVGGIYEISLSREETKKLEEGKYFYNVIVKDNAGVFREVISGLAFVEKSLASHCINL